MEDRALSEKLKGRTVIVVVDNQDSSNGMKDLVSAMLGPISESATVRILNWSEFLSVLPALKADLIVALSPRELSIFLPLLKDGLADFRRQNCGSVVLMNSLHCPAAPVSAGLDKLLSSSLLDHVEYGYTFFPILVHRGAEALHQKV